MDAERLAEAWYRGLVEPPEPEPAPEHLPVWAIEAQLTDGEPLTPLYEVDHSDRRVICHLHDGQMAAWESDRRFVFALTGKQWGKTVFGPLWLFREILRRGAGDYLAVSATYDLFKLKFLPALKQLFCVDLGIGRYWAGDQVIELCNPETGAFGAKFSHEHEKMWGRIILRSADSEKGLQSATAKAALLDEAGLYDWDVWKDVRGRLALNEGPALVVTTIYDLGWIKQQIYDPWIGGNLEIEVLQSESRVNPFFPQSEWESLQLSLPPHQFRMDYGAQFGRPPAAIFEDFVDELVEKGGHKYKRFIIPQDWPRYVSVDPGVVNPGKLWIAHDAPQNVYYVYRAEKGGDRMTSKEHAVFDVNRAKELNERVVLWAVGAKSEKYWREDYRNAGARNVREPDVSDVEEGIDRMILLIRQHRILFADDLVEIIDEILRYARVIKNGEVTKDIKDKSTFHLIDAFRYFAMQAVKGTPRKREAKAVSYIGN